MNKTTQINQIYTHASQFQSELETINETINRNLKITKSIQLSLLERLITLEKSNVLTSSILQNGLEISTQLPITELKSKLVKIKKFSDEFRNRLINYSKNDLKIETKSIDLIPISTSSLKTSLELKNVVENVNLELSEYVNLDQNFILSFSNSIERLNTFFLNASTNKKILKSDFFLEEKTNSFYKNFIRVIGHLECNWYQTNKKTNTFRNEKIDNVFLTIQSLKNQIDELIPSDRVKFIRQHLASDTIYKNLDSSLIFYNNHSNKINLKQIKSNHCPYFYQVFDKSSQFRNNQHRKSFHIFIYRELYQFCKKENIAIGVIDEIFFILFPDKEIEPKNLRGYIKDLKTSNKTNT